MSAHTHRRHLARVRCPVCGDVGLTIANTWSSARRDTGNGTATPVYAVCPNGHRHKGEKVETYSFPCMPQRVASGA